MKVEFCEVDVIVIIIAVLVGEAIFNELFKLRKALVRHLSRETMSIVALDYFRVRLRLEQLVNRQVLFERVLRPVQMNRGEAELRCCALGVQLSFVAEFHIKDWATNADHELWHLKHLFARVSRRLECLPVDLLRDTVEVAEDDATLREAKHTIEGPLCLECIHQEAYTLLEAKNHLR